MGIIDDHGVGVADVNPRFDNGRRNEHIEGALNETSHHIFQLFPVHLAVSNPHASVWDKSGDHARDLLNILDAVIDKIHLPSAADFIGDCISNHLFTERSQVRFNRLAIGRWRGDGTEVACPHQTELKRPWNGRRGEGQSIHVRAQCFQFVLDGHAELLLFIDDHQPQILEFDSLANDGVGPD